MIVRYCKITLILLFVFANLLPAFAYEVPAPCPLGEAQVCFADGDCYCKVRTVEMTDTVETENTCYDEDDDGSCA